MGESISPDLFAHFLGGEFSPPNKGSPIHNFRVGTTSPMTSEDSPYGGRVWRRRRGVDGEGAFSPKINETQNLL